MRTVLLCVTCALAASATTAVADVAHIVGSPGQQIVLTPTCRRAVVLHPVSVHDRINIVAEQVHCLIRRPDLFRRCVRRLGPAPTVTAKFDHGPGKPGDWLGVDHLQAYVAAIHSCATLRPGD